LRDYQCPRCFSKKPGEGLRLVNGKPIPCECASPEHIEYLRARDIVAPEDLQWIGGSARPLGSRKALPLVDFDVWTTRL